MSREVDKIRGFPAFISAAIAGFSAFGFFMANEGEAYRFVITIGSGLSFFVTLTGLLAFSLRNGGTANIRVLSGLFFAVFLAIHIIFNFIGISIGPYIAVNGILLMLFVFLCYFLITRISM